MRVFSILLLALAAIGRSRPHPPPCPAEAKARYDKLTDKEYWDNRARGMGGSPTSGTEENLLGYPNNNRHYGENIFVHEFSHAILGGGVRQADPTRFAAVQAAYQHAMDKGL